MQISFHTQNCSFMADLGVSLTAQEIIKHLPLSGQVARWGDEIFFETGILASDFNSTLQVNAGDVAYWPEGKCLCIFFGRTPASQTEKPVPAGPVVVIGRTMASADELRSIQAGQTIRVSAVAAKPAAQAAPAAANSDRKLSQAEIDALVQKLLAERAEKEKKKAQGTA